MIVYSADVLDHRLNCQDQLQDISRVAFFMRRLNFFTLIPLLIYNSSKADFKMVRDLCLVPKRFFKCFSHTDMRSLYSRSMSMFLSL